MEGSRRPLTSDAFHPLDLAETQAYDPTGVSPTVFIFCAGGDIGLVIANKPERHKVAFGFKKPLQKVGLVPIAFDVTNKDSITYAFAVGGQKLGATPRVGVSNGSTIRLRPPPNGSCLPPHSHFGFLKSPSTVELSAVKAAAAGNHHWTIRLHLASRHRDSLVLQDFRLYGKQGPLPHSRRPVVTSSDWVTKVRWSVSSGDRQILRLRSIRAPSRRATGIYRKYLSVEHRLFENSL